MKTTIRRIALFALTLALVFALTACGGNSGSEEPVPGETTEYGTNEIADILNDGYQIVQTTCDETAWKGIFTKDGKWDKVYLAKAPMTAELYAKYDGISFDDEDYDAKKEAFVTYLEDATVTDITDRVPTQDELDKLYIGKTMGDLEAEGFENSGYSSNPDTLMDTKFYYDGPSYCITVAPELGTKIDMEDMSNNDIRKIVIARVEFQSLSEGAME